MNKRIIIVGPAAAGKDHLKKKFGERGFKLDVSYTSRPPREGEIDGIHYKFVPEIVFKQQDDLFYEMAKHGDYWYGTGLWEWDNCNIFIMETHGISQISKKDRKNCFVIYLNVDENIRIWRLLKERGWKMDNIQHRITMDKEKFSSFADYDMIITDPYF